MKKFLFGMFTFTLGLVIGIFFKGVIFAFFPDDMDGIVIGGILVFVVVVFFAIWWLAEKVTSKDASKDKPASNPEE